jgi:putative SOS response-associated peptidase YedK
MGPNGEELETAAIVTTGANRTLAPIHERMPVILPPEAYDLWLDGAAADAETAAAVIVPSPDDLLEALPVSDAVNKVANDNPQLLEPAPERTEDDAPPSKAPRAPRGPKKDDGQASLF